MAIEKGSRVEIPAHTDWWMRGDRYGEVLFVRDGRVGVRLDKSGKKVIFGIHLLEEVD